MAAEVARPSPANIGNLRILPGDTNGLLSSCGRRLSNIRDRFTSPYTTNMENTTTLATEGMFPDEAITAAIAATIAIITATDDVLRWDELLPFHRKSPVFCYAKNYS
jgi:hypothetical protein